MDTADQIMKTLTEQRTARATVTETAYQEDLAALHAEFRPVAERTRLQLAGLDAAQAETLAYADKIDRLVAEIAADGHRAPAQDLANWASDLRAPWLGNARSGFGATIAPLVESRTHLTIYDSDAAFAAHFSPAVLADVNRRPTTIDGFRGALGRVDGWLGTVRARGGAIEGLLQTIRDADPVTPRRS